MDLVGRTDLGEFRQSKISWRDFSGKSVETASLGLLVTGLRLIQQAANRPSPKGLILLS